MPKMNKWGENRIQFPRLIAEAYAAGAFTGPVIVDMALSMDLTVHQVEELIQRADEAWEILKEEM